MPGHTDDPRSALYLGMAIALLSAATGCHSSAATDRADAALVPAAPTQVVAAPAQLQKWPLTVRVQGSLLADEEAIIGSKLAGRIESVAVDLGSVVHAGAPMVILDRREIQLRIQQAEAQLRQACAAVGLTPHDAESELRHADCPAVMLEQALVDEAQAAVTRGKKLRPTNAISGGEYDTLVAQLKTAQARYLAALNAVSEQISIIGLRRAELALVRQQLDDAQITAPFTAIVETRHVSPGEYVQIGQALVTLVRAGRLRFTAGVPEKKAALIQIGQPVEIQAPGQTEILSAVISRMSPSIVQASRSVRIEIDVPNDQLQLPAGLFAEAEIVVDPERETWALPSSAVSQFAGVQKVWVVDHGVARQRTVRIGRRDAQRVEILEGIQRGDMVVLDAAQGVSGPVIVQQSLPATSLPTVAAGAPTNAAHLD